MLTARTTSIDHDEVRISMVLGPREWPVHTYTPPMPRWKARLQCVLFGFGIEWEGRPVLRALIVP